MNRRTQLPISIHTEHLNLERIGFHHETLLYEIHSDERVTATLGGVKSRKQNREWVQEKVQHWEDNGYGLYVFFDHNEAFVGRGGLLRVLIGDEDEVEINYSIVADSWGQGYATEAATRFIELGFGHLPVESLIAFTLTTNIGSKRVMEKIGMTHSHEFTHHGHPHALYRIHRPTNAVG